MAMWCLWYLGTNLVRCTSCQKWVHKKCSLHVAVEARNRTGWNKFRQLVPMLTNMDISLIMKDWTAVVCKVVCCIEVRPGL